MKDILTEQEAKERWCPLARAQRSENRQIDGSPNNTQCIASECMAWRLAHKPSSNGDETGYCGAFGVPRFT